MKRVLSMLVENKPGALARVVGLFHQRGYNIESLNVAPVDDGSYSRLTVATRGTESAVEQIMKQINKLIDIIKVADLTEGDHHELELALIKISKVVDLTSMKKIIKPLNGKILKNDSTDNTHGQTHTAQPQAHTPGRNRTRTYGPRSRLPGTRQPRSYHGGATAGESGRERSTQLTTQRHGSGRSASRRGTECMRGFCRTPLKTG